MNTDGALDTCSLCPRLCRAVCPVANGTHREAATPTAIADVLRAWRRGQVSNEDALQAATLCVDCGACQSFCHVDSPLPDAIASARADLGWMPSVAPLGRIEGEGDWVAVESDERPWAAALAARIGAPVARLATRDALGAAMLRRAGFAARASALRVMFEARMPVVADGGCAVVLAAAGVPFRWLDDVVGQTAEASCARGGAGCCGGAGPLAAHHPADAARMARAWSSGRSGALADSRCAAHLRAAGLVAVDSVDRLMEDHPDAAGGSR
jgi:hypothetical protein